MMTEIRIQERLIVWQDNYTRNKKRELIVSEDKILPFSPTGTHPPSSIVS